MVLKVRFYFMKAMLYPLVFLDHRWYMKLYNKVLKSTGMAINGTPRFVAFSVKFDDFNLITLGDRLVVSSNVIFLTHDYSYTTGLISLGESPLTDIGILGPITVGNNVFIGMNSIILPGSKIGNNVIVGAGSVIRGIIPDYSVISGNPAQLICDIKEHTIKLKKKEYVRRIDTK